MREFGEFHDPQSFWCIVSNPVQHLSCWPVMVKLQRVQETLLDCSGRLSLASRLGAIFLMVEISQVNP